MKIRTGEIVDKNKDKNVVSSVKLSKGTRVGTLKLTVNGEEQDSVPIRGLGGGSSTVIGGSVDTQALWDAINKKVDVDFFKNLFTVYDSSDIEIATNTYARKPDNLKISVGTWTEEYLSALGKNSEGGGGGGGVGTVIGIALGTGTTPIYPDDDTGIVTLPAYPNKVSQLVNDSGFVTSSTLNNYVTSSYLANNFYTKAQADSKYMTIAAFESLFNALDSNGDKINHPYSSGVDSIKALVGLWTEEYLSALGQNSEGGSSGGGSVNAIKVGTNPDTYLDPVEGIIDMSNYVTTAAQRTLWTNSAHTHINKAVLDNITAGQVAAWNNMAAIMGEDQDDIINKWNEVVAFLSTYTEADTLANLLSNKLDVEFFRRIFTVYDEDGNIIVPNTYTQVADNLKILVGTWTEEYLSALGKNSEEGGGGTGTVTAVKIASNPDVFIDPVDGIIDMSSYAATWNNKQNAISDLATIRSNASNGNTAYSWGNHANAGYALASNTVSDVAYNTTGKKLTKTINGNTTDIVTATAIVTDGGGAKASTTITAGNGLTGGGDLSSNRTINVVSANAAITVNADNIKLNVINDYTTTTNNTIIPLAAAKGKDLNDRLAVLESWFEVDSDGNVKTKDMPNGTHRGFYTESFVSALGANSSGGGSSTFDEEQMWTALQSTSGTYATTKIATSHIPDMASTYGYLKASSLNGYATQAWVNQQGFLTTHQSIYALTLKADGTAVTTFTPNSADASLDFVAGTNISLTRGTNQITIANTYSYTLPLAASGTRGGVQIGYSESGKNYAVKLSSEKMYVNVPWTDTTYKLTLNGTTNGASGGTSLGSFYAPTAVGTDGYVLKSSGSGAPSWVAQSILSVGTAAKLNTGTTTYSAWGQTYWSSGVPQSISGNMTSVGSITPSANGNALGTTSARFNIYGTSGNFSGNVSISGTLGVTGATTLSSTLSVASGITLTTTKKIYFGDTSHYLELDSTGFHFSHGVYSDSFISALGANSSGGGSGTFDEEAMWTALGTTSTAKVIASSHIPNLSWAKITSDKPTTLSGYGITNAYTKTQVDNALSGYLPLSGGTLTGGLVVGGVLYTNGFAHMIKFDVDTSRALGYAWSDTNSNTVASIVYHNTAQNIILNPIGSASVYSDAVGKYSLVIGNNKLTYNTYPILHSNNFDSYALPLIGGTLTSYLNIDRSPYGAISLGEQLNVLRARCMNAESGTFAYNSVISLFGSGETGTTVNNLGVRLGSQSGATWISAGESGKTLSSQYTDMCNTENVYITADGSIRFFTGCSNDGTSFVDAVTINSSGNLIVTGYVAVGTGGTDSYLASDSATNIYLKNSSGAVLVCDGKVVRRSSSSSMADCTLGNSTYPWGGVYATTFYGALSGNAATATKATQDGDGRTITSTYLTSIGRSGDYITQTKGGTTSNVTKILERNGTYTHSIGATGWYRIGRFLSTASQSASCILLLSRTYAYKGNESYAFSITLSYSGKISISQLAGYYHSTQLIDKIRVEYLTDNTSFYPPIDIHINEDTTGTNTYRVTFIGGAQALSEFEKDPTLTGSTFEYNVSTGMGTAIRTTDAIAITTGNSNGVVGLLASTNRGVYDHSTSTWIVGTNGTDTWLSQGNVGIGNTDPAYKLDVNGSTYSYGYIYLGRNNYGLYTKDSGGSVRNTVNLNSANELLIGYGTAGAGYNTYLYGNSITLKYGTSRTTGITLSSSGATTFAGTIEAKSSAYNYTTDATSYGLNMHNSDIVNVNGIFTNDVADNWTEGINFKRTDSKWDSLWAKDGYFFMGYSGNTTISFMHEADSYERAINLVGESYTMSLAIGSGKINRGLYCATTSKWLLYFNASNTILNYGNVGIGTTTPGYKLGVVGTVGISSGHLYLTGAAASSSTGNTTQIVFTASGTQQVAISSNSSALIINPTSSTTTGQIVLGVGTVNSTFGTNIISKGEVTAQSDERKKNIISDTKFSIKDIASARSIIYEWNDGRDKDKEKKIHGGSIAQDWLGKADSFLMQDEDGFYSINYGALALCSAITIAREVVKHEDEITRLKKVVVKQAKEIVDLKNKVRELEERRVA